MLNYNNLRKFEKIII